jgi:large subunit ribosomal protein L10
MKSKEQKQEALDALKKDFPESTITIFTTFARDGEAGLSVSQMEELKAALREAEGEYVVAKKRLVEKALLGLKYEGIDVFSMDGSMGLVFGSGDAYVIAKALHQFSKANPSLKLFSAWMGDHVLTSDEVMDMALMPSRDELIVRLLGLLNYPLRSLAIVLNQIAENKPAEAVVAAPAEETKAEEPKEEQKPAEADEKPAQQQPAEGEAVETTNE